MSDSCQHSSPVTLAKELADPSVPGGRAAAEVPGPGRPTLRLAMRSTSSTSTADPLAEAGTETPQDPGSQPSAQLLALAELMEGWAAALPRWDSRVTEPWFVFLERTYKAETALAERLGRLPTCRLSMCPVREQVHLTLAGISVSTEQGLAAACRAWAQKARAHGKS